MIMGSAVCPTLPRGIYVLVAADYLCRTRNPLDPEGDPIDVVFPAGLTEKWYKQDPVRYENLRAAKFVLENVKRIFRGVRRLNEGFWCFTGRPSTWNIRQDVIVPFPDKFVFAVCVDSLMRTYDCRAEYVAVDDPLCPINWQDRYEGLVWKSTS